MPIPFVQECNESMSIVTTAAGDIEEAIQAVLNLVGSETWTGPMATSWETDLNGFVTDARNSLGTPLDEAIETARANAREWQRESSAGAVN
ncbi:hypothetical protein E1212_11045 [Jiangella ureilytica]|uniref:WXG100 family type VII secretion target n=1 Tax=Jiangella ureilytica TaxID=2530374 RepID=A0A4R4RSI0_9ACTN|nr:hypothetical protein [Jiangella ureilytica]TDC51732.1 hypothetical protein E1212_11045 [Jiangella ureilytica]